MKKSKRIFIALFFIVLFVISADFLYNGFGRSVSSPLSEDYDIDLLNKVYNKIKDNYVEKIDENEIIEHLINHMLENLDPYTDFYDRARLLQLKTITTGEYGGVGFYISKIDEQVVFISALENSPARRAGIRPGDVLVKVDDVTIDSLSLEEITNMIKGPEKTKVALSIKRNGQEDVLSFMVTREVIHLKDVPYLTKLANDIGYIKLSHFSRNAAKELSDAINELSKTSLSGLILDLRGNPGGLLTSAVEVVDLFVKKGEVIVSTKGRNDKFNTDHTSSNEPVYGEKPLVVIVDNVSASASEILAGAIQDLDRGVIAGNKTFGKGLVQTIFNPTKNTALKLTTAWYYTPSGRCIDKTKMKWKNKKDESEEIYYTKSGRIVYGGGGITPDVVIDSNKQVDPEFYEKSLFLKFAVNYANNHTDAESVIVDDSVLKRFKEFIVQNGYKEDEGGLREVAALEKIGKDNNYGKEFSAGLEKIKKRIKKGIHNKFDFDDEVMLYTLAREMNWVLGGEKARIEAVMNNDIFLNRAVEILENSEKYSGILENSALKQGNNEQ